MYLVFDIGGTKMRLGSSFDGKNFHDITISQTPQNFDEALELIKDFADKSADISKDGNLLSCGVPGVLDPEKKMLISAPNLPFWITKPLKTKLEEITRAKVFLNNDCSLSALGEATDGAGKGFPIVAFIAIGTGVGGARIVNGKIDVAKFGFEPGHQIINADVIVGGRMVDFENLVSGIGIQTRYGKKAENLKDPEVWAEVEKFLSIGIANTILHWSPDIVVLGGGLMQNEFISLERIHKNISMFVKVFPVIPQIKKSVLGDEAGLRGGLEYLKSDHQL